MRDERPPRARLIRLFLAGLVGCMAGVMGWAVVTLMVLLGAGATASGPLPPVLQAIAFLGPAVAAGYWFWSGLKPRDE